MWAARAHAYSVEVSPTGRGGRLAGPRSAKKVRGGEIRPSGGVTSVGTIICVCNIMLSRRGVASSNRSTPQRRPCWVISHSSGSSHTHARSLSDPNTCTHTHRRANRGTYGPRSTGRAHKKPETEGRASRHYTHTRREKGTSIHRPICILTRSDAVTAGSV